MNNISKEKKEEMKYLEENSLNEKELKNLKKKGFSLNEIKKYAKYKQEQRFYYYGYIIEIITWILA